MLKTLLRKATVEKNNAFCREIPYLLVEDVEKTGAVFVITIPEYVITRRTCDLEVLPYPYSQGMQLVG